MTVGELKKALYNVSDNIEIFIHNEIDISYLIKVEKDTYGGNNNIPCIIFKTKTLKDV